MSTHLSRINADVATITDSADIVASASNALVAFDAKVVLFGQGLLSARPSPGTSGRIYWATDVNGGTQFYDNGSAWLVGNPPADQRWEPGDMKWSGRATPSAGWLACDFSAVSRTTYSDLYAAIGTTYGAGDGSTTFNLPDSKGRTLIGAGAGSGLTARTLGAKIGAETIALSIANMPSHDHGGATGGNTATITGASAADHTHTAGTLKSTLVNGTAGGTSGNTGVMAVSTGTGVGAMSGSTGGASALGVTITQNNHAHSITAQGSATPVDKVQPSLVANLFIKT